MNNLRDYESHYNPEDYARELAQTYGQDVADRYLQFHRNPVTRRNQAQMEADKKIQRDPGLYARVRSLLQQKPTQFSDLVIAANTSRQSLSPVIGALAQKGLIYCVGGDTVETRIWASKEGERNA